MRYRLQPVSWMIAILLLLAGSTGIAHAAPIPTSASVPASTTNADFSKFAGLWTSHGSFIVVARDGNVRFGSRTYNWCSAKVPQPCDSIVNNQLRYGYHAQITLTHASSNEATGTVIDTNQQPGNLHTTVTLTLGPENTLIYSNNGTIAFFCGPDAPAGTCGA